MQLKPLKYGVFTGTKIPLPDVSASSPSGQASSSYGPPHPADPPEMGGDPPPLQTEACTRVQALNKPLTQC